MLEAYFLEFDLNTHKLDHMFETAIDQLDVTAMELSVLENTGMYSDTEALDDMFYEAAGKFVEMVKTFFQKIREYIKKLYNSVKDAIQSAIRKYECKKKLKELKDQLDKANEFAKSVGGKSVEIIDTRAIYKAYSELMDTMLKEVHRLYSKTYDNVDDYDAAVKRCGDAIEDKADGYSKVLASILSEIKTIKAEEDRLEKRRKHLESRYTLLKDNLKASLEACGKYKFKTALFSYNIRSNPAHVVLDCKVLDLPKELIKYAAPQADLAGIKSILDGGAEFPFAHLEQSKSLVIR